MADRTGTLTSMAKPSKWIGACEARYPGARMIIRGTVELKQGMTASIGFIVVQNSGASDRKVPLRLGNQNCTLAIDKHVSSSSAANLQPGSQDVALVRYDHALAVYVNGAKVIDVPVLTRVRVDI